MSTANEPGRLPNGQLNPARFRRPPGQPPRGPTRWMTDDDGQPLDRDDFAVQMYWLLDPPGPLPGDRVRLHFPDGSTADGTMTVIASQLHPGLVMDDGQAHTEKPADTLLKVTGRAEQPKTTLSLSQVYNLIELLEQLARAYAPKLISGLAQMMADLLTERTSRRRVVLIENEVAVIVSLLGELGGLYPHDEIGVVAHSIAEQFHERSRM